MTGERTYPILPCADLDQALEFYRALGFEVTYSQRRPNPYAVVARDDLQIHLSGIEGFVPEISFASVIITVTDPGQMHEAFSEGLRERFGKVPRSGIPRILPLRCKAGTASGFSVVDVGGNWLRFYLAGDHEETADEKREGLARVIDVAARQGDSRGDEAQAISVLDAGLLRYPDATAEERFEAVTYRAELTLRIGGDARGDIATATAMLDSHSLGEAAEQRLVELREI